MSARRARAEQRGQATVEWIALVLLVSLVVAALGAVLGIGLPGAALARAIGAKLVCAAELSGSCGPEGSRLAEAYGDEIAALVGEHAPTLRYERGMRALPVDYRRCREDACAEGAAAGEVWRSLTGEPTTAFIHVVDCRPGAALARAGDADCSGERAGNVYLQYWFYYPGSATAEGSIAPELVREVSTAVGAPSHHPDDWESYQLRIGPAGRADARASSHHWYSYALGAARGWGPAVGSIYVSGGSHAGNVVAPREVDRTTPAGRLRLVPLESLGPRVRRARFAVTPPWRKRVWRDPEYEGTG